MHGEVVQHRPAARWVGLNIVLDVLVTLVLVPSHSGLVKETRDAVLLELLRHSGSPSGTLPPAGREHDLGAGGVHEALQALHALAAEELGLGAREYGVQDCHRKGRVRCLSR